MQVETVQDAVRVLGGDTKVARWLGCTQGNVANMKVRGYVARGYHLHFYLTLRARGFSPLPQVFGILNWDGLVMPRAKVRKQTNSHK